MAPFNRRGLTPKTPPSLPEAPILIYAFQQMSTWIYELGPVFIVAFVVAYVLTPFFKRLANSLKIMDIPSARKVHRAPIARTGGMAVFCGFVVAVVAFQPMTLQLLGILFGGGIILSIGMIDDGFNMRPWVKLLGQCVGAAIPILFGVLIPVVTNPFGGVISLGIFAYPLTLFWFLVLMNTMNLIDGLDGLASGISAIASAFLAVIAFLSFQWFAATLMVAICGASLAFLRYNFSPAEIFLGDCGSMFIGYMLAVASIAGCLKSPATISFLIPLIVLGIPIYDTAFAIVRRIKKRKPIFLADNLHIHHRLIGLGLSHKQAVLLLYSIGLILGCIGLWLSFLII